MNFNKLITRITLLILNPWNKFFLQILIILSIRILFIEHIYADSWYNLSYWIDLSDAGCNMDKAMGYYPENEDINPYSNDSYKEESKASDSEERNIVPDEFQSVIDYYTTLNNRGLTIEELLVELPHYSHNVYELPTDLNYMMTFEFQFLESNVFANDKGFLNILSVMLSNHQLHNNPPSHELQRDTIDLIIEHYTDLIQANLEIDVPQNFRTESEIRNSLKVPTEITLVEANPTLESKNQDIGKEVDSRDYAPGKYHAISYLPDTVKGGQGQKITNHNELSHMKVQNAESKRIFGLMTSSPQTQDQTKEFEFVSKEKHDGTIAPDTNADGSKNIEGQYFALFKNPIISENIKVLDYKQQYLDKVEDRISQIEDIAKNNGPSVSRVSKNDPSLYNENGTKCTFDD
jgi:hypothetical protein